MPIIATFRATVVPVAQSARDDFNGDGKSDLLWRSVSSGSNVIWRSAGSRTPQAVTRLYGSVWTVAGTGDFAGERWRRAEERRVGDEWGSTGRNRWWR